MFSTGIKIVTKHPSILDYDRLSSCVPPIIVNKWKQNDLKNNIFDDVPPLQPQQTSSITPVSLFKLFFDDEVIDFMVRMTNLYANRGKGKHNFKTDSKEMRLFLAMILLTGYVPLPRRKLYWENSPDVHNEALSNAMSQNPFEDILSNLHFSDNWKVCPLYNLIIKRCFDNRPNTPDLSVDESMIPYYGRNNSKQRIQNKPVRSGYKMWVLAESNGYVINFDPYQGAKNGKSAKANDKTWGLGEIVILSHLDVLPENVCYRVTTDNFFTSFRLVQFLATNKIGATRTVRPNRMGNCTINSKKSIEKYN